MRRIRLFFDFIAAFAIYPLIIVGGAVRGGDIYGKFPTLKLGGTDDVSSEGRWIPTSSVEQYAATLTSWFGLNAAELSTNFPNLSNFPDHNLGFMA